MGYDGEIEKASDLVSVIGPMADTVHAHVRLWFRGQPKAGWELKPGVYRPETFVETTEPQIQLKERHLHQDFTIWSAGLRRGDETAAQIYFLQQHYRMPSRLLDWSNSPLAGLFFAVKSSKETDDADAELFTMDAYKLAPAQDAKYRGEPSKPFLGIATSTNPEFVAAIKQIDDWIEPAIYPRERDDIRPSRF